MNCDCITWWLVLWAYVGLATATFVPVLVAILRQVKNHMGIIEDAQFDLFTQDDTERNRLQENFKRLKGTLVFWKLKVEWNRRFNYYTVFWTVPASILIPILTQVGDACSESNSLITVISAHVAILLALHGALKIESNFHSLRKGESAYYDTYRRLLDRPKSFGETKDEQIEEYFRQVEEIRRNTGNIEVGNFPKADEPKG